MKTLSSSRQSPLWPSDLCQKAGFYWVQNKGTLIESSANKDRLVDPMEVLKKIYKKNKNLDPMAQQNLRVVTEAEKQEVHRWIKEIAEPTLEGFMVPFVIDDNQRWLLIRREKNSTENQYNLTALQIPKIDFQDWILEVIKKTPVNVH